MVRRKRIDAGLDIGEILLEQRRPVGFDALVNAGTGFRLRWRAVAARNLFREPAHDIEVPGIPGHARHLARRIGDARRQT